MPQTSPADRIIEKGIRIVNRGLTQREAIGKTLSQETLLEIVDALVDKAKGACLRKDVKDLRGVEHTHYYTIAPDAKAARIIFELAGIYPETTSSLMAIIAKAKKDVALAEMVVDQRQFIRAQSGRVAIEAEAYTISQVTPETIEDGISHLCAALIGKLQSIPREDMLDTYCRNDEDYQKLHRMFAQFAMAQLAQVLDELRARVVPPAIGSLKDQVEKDDTDES